MVSRSRGGPRIYHHLAGVERLLDELLVTTHPRRHSGVSGTPNDFEAPTVDLATTGRSPGRPARVVENGVGLGFQPLCSASSVPWRYRPRSHPMSTQALMRILIIVGVCLVLLIVVNVAR